MHKQKKSQHIEPKIHLMSFLGLFTLTMIVTLAYILKYYADSLLARLITGFFILLALLTAVILNISGGVFYYHKHKHHNIRAATCVFSLCITAAAVCLIPVLLIIFFAVTLWLH